MFFLLGVGWGGEQNKGLNQGGQLVVHRISYILLLNADGWNMSKILSPFESWHRFIVDSHDVLTVC